MSKPVWLLDIDGVINAVAKRGDPNVWPADSWLSTVASANGSIWPILFSAHVRDFINEMAASGQVDVRWHTTWQKQALHFAQAVGIVELEVQDCPEFQQDAWIGARHGYSNRWWKIGAAERVVLDEQRRLIWTDDDLLWEANNVAHFRKDNLFIAPHTNLGLTNKALSSIREFVDAYAAV